MLRLRYLPLLAASCLVTAARAQLSVAVAPTPIFDETIRPGEGGPYFLDDTTLVYADRLGLYTMHTRAGSRPVRVPGIFDPPQGLRQDSSGRVYFYDGGSCDVVFPVRRVYTFDLDASGNWDVATAAELPRDVSFGTRQVQGFDVSDDGTAWFWVGGQVYTLRLASGRWRSYTPSGEFKLIGNGLEAVDSTRAFYRWGFRVIHIDLLRRPQMREVLQGRGRVLRWHGGGLSVLTGEEYVRANADGAIRSRQALPVMDPSHFVFAADSVALLVHGDTLTRWNFLRNTISSESYYPEDVYWRLEAAALSRSGGLAVYGFSKKFSAFIPEAIPPAPQGFIQFTPTGESARMLGPRLGLEVRLRPISQVSGAGQLTYEITLTNLSDELIDSAEVRTPDFFGAPCREFYNGGRVEDLPPGTRARASNTHSIYYTSNNSTPGPGDTFEATFTVTHANGRPVAATDTTFDLTLVALHDITPAPDVTLYPTLAATTVTVEYTDPRRELLVLDALGRVAFRQNLDAGQTRATVDVTGFGESLYYLLLSSDDATSVHSFTVQR